MSRAVQKIRSILIRRGWTQAFLAEKIGITPVYFSLILCERRKPADRTKELVALATNNQVKPVDWLKPKVIRRRGGRK